MTLGEGFLRVMGGMLAQLLISLEQDKWIAIVFENLFLHKTASHLQPSRSNIVATPLTGKPAFL